MKNVFILIVGLLILASCVRTKSLETYLDQNSQDGSANNVIATPTPTPAPLDKTSPTSPSNIMDGIYFNSLTTTPTITWAASSDASGIHHYEIALGTSSGATDVINWTDVGNVTGKDINSLSLLTNTMYYPSLRAVDNAGNISDPAIGNGWLADTTPPTDPSALTLSTNKISIRSTNSPILTFTGSTDVAGSGLSGYEILISDLSEVAMNSWSSFASGNSVVLPTLAKGNYKFKLRASDNATNVSNVISSSPLQLGLKVAQISTGMGYTCAVLDNGILKCWGLNDEGQLGYDDTTDRGGDTGDMANLSGVNLGVGRTAKLVAVNYYHSCAILDNNTLKCWGSNWSGKLGYDDSINRGDKAGDMASLSAVNLGVGRTVKSIALGESHTCAILDNDTLKCWGYNSSGELGYDNQVSRGDNAGEMAALGTVNLGAGRTAKAISLGLSHSCAILDNDTLKCWGKNNYGQLGYNDTANRGDNAGEMAALGTVNLGVGRTAKAISLGWCHTCAILDNDTVKCWGRNDYGQLGYDDTSDRGDGAGEMTALGTVNLGAGRTAKAISLGWDFTCVILDNDQLKCWGGNNSGQLGYGDVIDRGSSFGSMTALAAVDLGPGRTAKSLALGDSHTCVVLDDDTMKCWGENSSGQLGYEDYGSRGDNAGLMTDLPAVNLGIGRYASAVSVNESHSCAILDDFSLKCWGENIFGQLGYDDAIPRGDAAGEMAALSTVNLGIGRTAKKVNMGGKHACAILDNDSLKCWGDNNSGQLGYDDSITRGDHVGEMAALSTVNLGIGRSAKAIALGYAHTCAILDNDSLKCWGNNSSGDLGYDDTAVRGRNAGNMAALTAVNLGIGRTAKSVSLGYFHTCAILDNDSLKCWGDNSSGQLGYDDLITRGDNVGEMAALGTVNLGVGRTAKSVTLGFFHTCAILDNDSLKCWGDNSRGQLGYDDLITRGDNVGEMAALGTVNLGEGRTAKSVSLGIFHTCAILDNDSLKCWGDNSHGQLGYDDTTFRGLSAGDMAALATVNLGSGRTAKSISTGRSHTCAVLDNNQLKCWGYNEMGQVGQDSTGDWGKGPRLRDQPVVPFLD